MATMLLIGLVVNGECPAGQIQERLDETTVARIEAVVSSEMSRQNIPSVAVAVGRGNTLLWSGAFGLADLENNVPAKTTTVYRLASVSKPMTAAAVLQLAEQNKVDLDAPIQRYCPAFPPKAWPITTRELLAHTSGIRHYKDNGGSDWTNPEINSARHFATIVESLAIFKDDDLIHEPGTEWSYSTYGYNVLGCVIEGATGTTFADYMQKHIFDPAQMKQARIDETSVLIAQRAHGYGEAKNGSLENAPLSDTSNKIPGGGICATAEDLVRFAIALNTNRLIRPESREVMFKEVTTRLGKKTGYGLGWFIMARNGEKVVRHGGSSQGSTAGLYVIPSRGYFLAILANKQDVNTFQFDKQITNIVLP